MKSILKITLIMAIIFSWPFFVLADSQNGHKSEIEEGQKIAENKIDCDDLNDEQLEAVGEYLMEQMHPGKSHEAMHQMMGMEEGTEYHKDFHINMAKTMYCREGGTMAMMPMMNMMRGGGNSMMGNMMNSGNWGMSFTGWNWFAWIFMILFWILIIVGIIALIKWLLNQTKTENKSKTALDVLKERYAKGEIDKKEFEEKKKDLS